MSSQITFYEKNKLDLENTNVVMTVTDTVATSNGQDIIDFVRNRKQTSAWLTTDSTDAANTQIDINMGSAFQIDTIILLGHNFADYTIQYFNGSIYADLPTAINVTGSTDTDTRHQFAATQVQILRLIITGTQTPDADKILKQFIVTDSLGQFNGWPIIKKPTLSTNRRRSKMLSGKTNIVESIGAFSCELTVEDLRDDADLTLIEEIYFRREGVLMQLNGFDEAQFSSVRAGYRNEDIFLMKPNKDYVPEWKDGVYVLGQKVKMSLEEVIS